MAIELARVWAEITPLLKDGISLIPVRDKPEGEKKEKTPYGASWKQFQSRVATEGELYSSMEYYDTTAVAIVAGAVSGNLECIDVDTKYFPGFDAILFSDLAKFYPQLYARLRIHKTPSGGYHILYRIVGGAPDGNKHLAKRYATEQEIHEQQQRGITKPPKTVCFVETRGEGGFFLCPPSMGYSVHQNMPIPILTWEERCSLINLCKSYDEVVRVAPSPKPTQAQESIYTTNPFEDYNHKCDPTELMEAQGWKFFNENSTYIRYTRPGKDSGVSATFHRESRVFYLFTTSTDLEEKRGYNPATLYAEFYHGGDKSKAFRALVQLGYGQVKKQFEQSHIKKAVINGNADVPNNFSAEAKQQFRELQDQFKQAHPYGTFWIIEDDKYTISREDFLTVARNIGFRHYNGSVVQINQRFIERVTLIEFFDTMKAYIQEEEVETYTKICNAFEKFVQASGKFIAESRLDKFDDTECLADSADVCYKFYNNTAVRVTADAIAPVAYDDIEGYIWSDKMLSRDFLGPEVVASSLYESFLKNATGVENGNVKDSVRNIIGYLTHDFKSESAGYVVVMQEMVSDPKLGGGSGKNIFGNILRNMTTVCTVPGSSVQFNEKFLQAWNYQRIYFLADIPKRIDWMFLKEQATGFGLLKKLYRNEEEIAPELMPKILINTNYSFEDSDGGLKRRIRVVEFTDYYTKHGGVDGVHGKLFPTGSTKGDWTDQDWKGFDDFVLNCIQYNLAQGGKLQQTDLSQIGWEKKFTNQFGDKTLEFLMDNMSSWTLSDHVEVKNFQRAYDDYVAGDLKEKYKLTQQSLNKAVREFCERYNITFIQSQVKSIPNQGSRRVHIFTGSFEDAVREEEFPF